jgi:hypothetical protein
MSKDSASSDEHVIICSECGRELIVKDIVNNGVAFLSHLKIDHGITYTPQRMTEAKTERKRSTEKLIYKTDDH